MDQSLMFRKRVYISVHIRYDLERYLLNNMNTVLVLVQYFASYYPQTALLSLTKGQKCFNCSGTNLTHLMKIKAY